MLIVYGFCGPYTLWSACVLVRYTRNTVSAIHEVYSGAAIYGGYFIILRAHVFYAVQSLSGKIFP